MEDWCILLYINISLIIKAYYRDERHLEASKMKIYDRNFHGACIISKMGQNKDIETSRGPILLKNTEKGMYMHIS